MRPVQGVRKGEYVTDGERLYRVEAKGQEAVWLEDALTYEMSAHNPDEVAKMRKVRKRG